MKPKVIFAKDYSDESLIDLQDDIIGFFEDTPFEIPQDEDGFRIGTFTVTVTWSPEEMSDD